MPTPLIATYRLQLNAEFTLHDARMRVPYLHELGVSHLYCSPVLAARAGSTHGYDVADPTHVSEALGGDEALVALADAAHAHDMGIVLDIVPNHMGIGPDNPYWDDVLAHGRGSRYADWFDVAWRAPTKRLTGRILVPILGDTLEKVLARGEITLEASDQGVRVRYFTHSFPVDPTTLPPELELAQRDPGARDLMPSWVAGEHGQARLRSLLANQHYELAFWRTAQRDINYRRFFDVNELISLRVEQRDVFDATHHAVLEFVAKGIIDGLRIDHVDGLLEPRRYLERLRAAVDVRRPPKKGEQRFPIFVEKILAANESLPADWPVDGTTGYEFLTALEDIFIDPAGHAEIERRYRHGREEEFQSIALASKRRVLRTSLNADVRRIAPMLASLAKRARWPQRAIADYAGVIVELVAALPVYRTYIDAEHPEANARDRPVLEKAFGQLKSRSRTNDDLDGDALHALERSLLGEWKDAEPDVARARLAFVLRWQQLTGPAAAKGIEDTALYVYAPLTSRNEVGGDPGLPVDGAVKRLCARLAERADEHPRSLNATNTHDTKRSADARARLDALSEHADEWEHAVRRWHRWHRPLRALVNGRLAPTRAAEDFIYQAMVGIWPLDRTHTSGDEWLVSLRDRLTAYLQKAMREAKLSTSWRDPDPLYEAAIANFLARLLDVDEGARSTAHMQQFVTTIAPQAMWNALGRLVVHLLAPGVPDLYQGDELWFAALVDPDNRRPVDWAERGRVLSDAERTSRSADRCAQLRSWRDAMQAGELKMFITREVLAFRHAHSTLVSAGGFEQLDAEGEYADRLFAFRRALRDRDQAVVLVGRRTAAIGNPPVGDTWRDTRVDLGSGVGAWRCLIHGTRIAVADGQIRIGDAFSVLPVAVLVPVNPTPDRLVS
jgi:(1->4)-alpha-D-glucan 1-alpha-D-glucosylmutase